MNTFVAARESSIGFDKFLDQFPYTNRHFLLSKPERVIRQAFCSCFRVDMARLWPIQGIRDACQRRALCVIYQAIC